MRYFRYGQKKKYYEGGGRYEANGSDFDQNFRAGGGSSPQPRTNSHSHGAADDLSDSKSQGAPFDVRRPSDYHSSVAATPGPSQPNPNLNLAAVGLSPSSAGGLDGPDCIFVGGFPYYFTEAQVRKLLESFGPLRGFDLVKDRETGKSKGYAFCVYQNLSVTDIVCAALNGIKMGDKTLTVRRANQGANQVKPEQESVRLHAQQQIALQGAPVKIGSPSDYNPSLATTLGPSQPNPNLNLAAVGPDSIFVGGLPYYFTEAQVKELLESFGPLRGFDLVKDRETGKSKGYAFCVYQDLSVTDIACAALNGIKMGDKTLAVRRANQGANQVKPEQESVLLLAQQQIALQRLTLQPVPTKVVCLTQVVNPSELEDDNEYEDIVEDMRTEGEKFGSLANVVIPRPKGDGVSSPGVGKVFLEYADIEGATRAQAGMNGRKFAGNYVVAIFFPENKFYQGEYEG